MPKYILPSNNNRFNRSKSLRKSKKYRDEDSSSDEERFWNPSYNRTSTSTENTQGKNSKFHFLKGSNLKIAINIFLTTHPLLLFDRSTK